jgi:hypothetical protein
MDARPGLWIAQAPSCHHMLSLRIFANLQPMVYIACSMNISLRDGNIASSATD